MHRQYRLVGHSTNTLNIVANKVSSSVRTFVHAPLLRECCYISQDGCRLRAVDSGYEWLSQTKMSLNGVRLSRNCCKQAGGWCRFSIVRWRWLMNSWNRCVVVDELHITQLCFLTNPLLLLSLGKAVYATEGDHYAIINRLSASRRSAHLSISSFHLHLRATIRIRGQIGDLGASRGYSTPHL